MRKVTWILVVTIALSVAACRRKPVYKPVGYRWPVRRGEIASWKQAVLPGGGMQSHFEIFTKGIVKRKVGGHKIPSILVRLSCTNDTQRDMSVDAARTHIVDNTGRILRNTLAKANGDVSIFTRIPPRSHSLLDLYYDLPRGTSRNVKTFTFHWRYKVGSTPYQQASIFERGHYAE